MITTPELIDLLAKSAQPVRRLRSPQVRSAAWLSFAIAVLVVIALYHGLRSDIAERLSETAFLVQVGASLMTGVAAAYAAFCLSLPDRSPFWTLAPAPGFALWISMIGYGCLESWVSLPPSGLPRSEIFQCLGTIALTSAPLLLLFAIMLRPSRAAKPTAASMMGALSVASFAATGVSLIHDIEASIMVVMLNLGTVALMIALSGMFGHRMVSGIRP
ncbi:MAG: NrsF family protein [Alphaproteobacteria bacterium]